MDIDKISNLIKTKRKEKGLTQEELAQKLNVTEKAISRWETGRGTPDISLLVPLSEELDISVSELLKGKENKKEDSNIKEIVNYIDVSKTKKNKFIIPVATILYVIILILYLWYLKVEYNTGGTVHYTYLGELVYNFFFIISVFFTNRLIANYYYDTIEDCKRMNKVSYIIALVIYIIMFFNLTIFGRIIDWYNTYNLIPFKTIIGYWAFPNAHNTIINILGNIVILMPVQFLLMKIFDIKKFKISLIIDTSLSLLIEIIQLISHAGVFDIDDIILNVLGMSIVYTIVMDKHKIIFKHKELILTSILSLLITFVIFEAMSLYHFGDIPTTIVLFRLIIAFLLVEFIIYMNYKIIKKEKNTIKCNLCQGLNKKERV